MLFKILHGDDAYISLDIVPFHEGYCYVTYGGNMYVDMNTGTASEPNNQRIQLNAANAKTLCGMTLEEIKAELSSQSDWTQTDETASDYIKNKPTLGALASKDVIGLVYDEENESLSIEYGVHLAPGEEEAVPVTEMRVNQIVDESVTASEERMTALIEEAINGALEGEY